ncbi:IclR family transcriptional regulator [Nitrospirillum amazonense]|uniref:IclR family transcriptional regulator n=1 Tax=Nitrospirillum amazonense TaxID=28077 RepID=A0A560F9S9_9PROT|nr:IclR family transcriptional regulator [Nitrospirillum amazonense]TWB18376.1 IclR family transcriptional regulator [Nitrospirillum amazonense]TWB66103.1 IclR family transcriptional regulator [Nitrospirillum amazonense]
MKKADQVEMDEEGKSTAQPSGSQTLLRGLDVIDAVADGVTTFPALSERLGLTKSTAHRLASALVERGYLTFVAREGYALGPKLLELGWSAHQQMHLPSVARPHIERLAAETEDTVHLGILDGTQALYLDKVPGRRRVVIGSRVGERHPIISTGLGKALVLDHDEAAWRGFYEVRGYTTGMAVWLERMRIYSAKGYAFDLEENEDQIRCVAAPIRGASGEIVAALSVSSAAQYMADERMEALAEQVRTAAEDISKDLGWTERAGRRRPRRGRL